MQPGDERFDPLKEWLFKVAIMKAILFAVVLIIVAFSPLADSVATTDFSFYGWHELSNLYTNTYTLWRMPTYGLIGNYPVTILLFVAAYLGGMLLFSEQLNQKNHLLSIIASVIIIVQFTGIDAMVWGTIAFLPLLLCSIRQSAVASLFIFLAFIFHANQAAVLCLPLILLLSRQRMIDNILIAVISLSVPFLIRQPAYPPYSQNAHLVPRAGTVLGKDPWVGFASNIPVIDKTFEHPFLLIFVLVTIILSIYIIVRSQTIIHERSLSRRVGWVSLFFAVSILLDSNILPSELRIFSPLQSISRIIPGYMSIHLVPLSVALLCISHVVMALSTKDHFIQDALLGFFAVTLVGTGFFPLPEYRASFGTLMVGNSIPSRPAYISPSLFTIKNFPPAKSIGDWKPVQELQAEVSASERADQLKSLLSASVPRWSTGRGSQNGTEWISFQFLSPVTLSGIDLSLSQFTSDFPRGLVLYSFPRCDMQLFASEYEVIRYPLWSGSGDYENPEFPSLSHESTVRFEFPQIQTSCLVVRQIGRSKNFEWSVEGIKLLVS